MRKLATIRKIDDIRPIPDADAIECAVVGGWTVVVQKGTYAVGDLAIFIELDAFVPTNIAPFLSKGKEPSEFNGIKGERLRTVRLRKQLSQGLLLPLSEEYIRDIDNADYEEAVLVVFNNDNFIRVEEGQDVSDFLGILKWEAPIPASLAGQVRGKFPTSIPKTDAERIQNLTVELEDWLARGYNWEVTEKIDGTSSTFFIERDGRFGVCSRNWELTETEGNSYWRAARAADLETKMREFGRAIAIQGELVGEGIQGNLYKLKGHHIYVYNIYDIAEGRYLSALERAEVVKLLGLNHVPVVSTGPLSVNTSAESLLLYAEGKSNICVTAEREGLVFKCIEDPSINFKAISNRFLMKTGG